MAVNAKEIYKRFISCYKRPDGWYCEFKIGVQAFDIGRSHETKRDAIWYGHMLSEALARFLKESAHE